MDSNWLSILKEGGSVVLAGLLVLYCIKKDRANVSYLKYRDELYNKTMNNHLEHQQKIDIDLTAAITKLADRIDKCPMK